MKRPAMAILSVGALAVTVAGCGGGGGSNNPLSSTSGAAAAAKSITVYTSEPDADFATLVSAFNKKYPDIKVNSFRSGTEEVVSKVEAENKAGASKADVLFIADALTMSKLKKQGVLAQYQSPEAADIASKYVDPNHDYTGTKIITTGIAINTKKVKKAPTSWSVLTDPATRGQAEMPSPLYSGAAAYNVALMADNPMFGWSFWQKVAANKMTVTKGNGAVLQDLAKGQKSYAMVVDYLVARAAKQGSPVKFVYPSEGVPAITEPIALTKKAADPADGKKFIDFVLSKDGQAVAAKLGYVPIRPGTAAPNGLESIDKVKVLNGNTEKLASQIDSAKARFKSVFGQ